MIQKSNSDYLIPAKLVQWLIASIFGAILSIGGYMVIWAINDARVNAQRESQLKTIEKKLDVLNTMMLRHLDGHPERVEDQIEDVKRRVDRLEDAR